MQLTRRKWKGGHRGYLKARIRTWKAERAQSTDQTFIDLCSRRIVEKVLELEELNEALEVRRGERASGL